MSQQSEDEGWEEVRAALRVHRPWALAGVLLGASMVLPMGWAVVTVLFFNRPALGLGAVLLALLSVNLLTAFLLAGSEAAGSRSGSAGLGWAVGLRSMAFVGVGVSALTWALFAAGVSMDPLTRIQTGFQTVAGQEAYP